MTVPNTKFTKTDGQTGAVAATGAGMLVLIAASQMGVALQPATYTSPDQVLTDRGDGPLTQLASYTMNVSGKAVIVITPMPSIAATYSAFTTVGGGTSAPSAGVTAPLDDLDVQIKFVNAGNVTVSGILYQVSMDGGVTFGPVIALGVSSSIIIPNTGITVALTAGTILQDETISFSTMAARMSNADVAAALEALRVFQVPWEGVCVSGLDADHSTVDMFDLWLTAREAEGKFKWFAVNTRRKSRITNESEAAFLAAMTTVATSMASIRGIVGTDGADLINVGGSKSNRGIATPRDAAAIVAARAVSIDISEDPAFIGRGQLVGADINNAQNSPKYHDEQAYPGLDDIRLTSLRNVEGEVGTFVDNARVISEPDSDYVYLQHIRVMNQACALGWQRLQKRLSQSIAKDPKTGFILEASARSIEEDVNAVIRREMKGQVSAVLFQLSRDDDLSSNEGAFVTGELELDALAYIKGFIINAHFSRTLMVPV